MHGGGSRLRFFAMLPLHTSGVSHAIVQDAHAIVQDAHDNERALA